MRLKTDPVRHAFAGLGRICSLLEKDPHREKPATHAGAVAALKDSFIAAGCDPSSDRRERFLQDWKTPVLYESAGEMIQKEKIDILHIASHPDSHPQILKLAVEAGIAVIICEKPAAESLDDAGRMLKTARVGKSVILINHERRFSADYRLVKQEVSGRHFGRLLSIKGTLHSNGNRRADRMATSSAKSRSVTLILPSVAPQ